MLYRIQKAYEGVQMKEHDIKNDIGKGDKGPQAWDAATSISESAIMVVEMMNNNFSHIKDGTTLDLSGMNKGAIPESSCCCC